MNVSQIRGAFQRNITRLHDSRRVLQLARLPMTRSGKIDRRGLPERAVRDALDVPYPSRGTDWNCSGAVLVRGLAVGGLGRTDEYSSPLAATYRYWQRNCKRVNQLFA